MRTAKGDVCPNDVSALTSALLILVFVVGATVRELLRDLWAIPVACVEGFVWIGSRLRRPLLLILVTMLASAAWSQEQSLIGKEVAIPRHLQDGEEYELSIPKLIKFGEKLFTAQWTVQEGQGRANVKGLPTGPRLADPSEPPVFPRNFNRISGPDSNSCAGCHNQPFIGGGGDRATEVFVLGQRFDFASFDHNDMLPTKGATDERGQFVTLQTIANERKTIGMNGSGFIEMLARQMTADLQATP